MFYILNSMFCFSFKSKIVSLLSFNNSHFEFFVIKSVAAA